MSEANHARANGCLAEEKDVAQLKAELPKLTVEWNLPGEPATAKLRTTFQPKAP